MATSMASEADRGEKGLFKVKVLSTSHVKPKKPLGRLECELSLFDIMHLGYRYNQKLLIYKWKSGVVDHDDYFGNVVGKLMDGLRVVLVEFYHLAGKLWKDVDGVLKVVYDDDMDGVEVVAAVAEDVETADLMDGQLGLKELTPCNGLLNLEGLHQPLLAVQVII